MSVEVRYTYKMMHSNIETKFVVSFDKNMDHNNVFASWNSIPSIDDYPSHIWPTCLLSHIGTENAESERTEYTSHLVFSMKRNPLELFGSMIDMLKSSKDTKTVYCTIKCKLCHMPRLQHYLAMSLLTCEQVCRHTGVTDVCFHDVVWKQCHLNESEKQSFFA